MPKKKTRYGKQPPAGDRPLEQPSPHSLRLTFQRDGAAITLVHAKRIDMIAPPTDVLGKLPPMTGFCVELATRRGRVLYRRFGTDPMHTGIETPSDDPQRPFQRTTNPNPTERFDLLVPVIDEAAKLELFSDLLEKEPGPARCVATIDLASSLVDPRSSDDG